MTIILATTWLELETTGKTNILVLGVSKKTEKPIKLKKPKKKPKKPNREKKPIKPIRIFKKIFGSVRFRFDKPETEKTELNRTEPVQF